MKDFFVSYTSADKQWAEWIAFTLEDAGYTSVIQAWDFKAGQNFVVNMDKASRECRRMVAVLSPQYLGSVFTQAEWTAAFAEDPLGRARAIIPVLIELCELPRLLAPLAYCDLVGKDEQHAEEALLAAVDESRSKPEQRPAYPPRPAMPQTISIDQARSGDTDFDTARQLLGLLDTTSSTFQAQARVRNQLVKRAKQRLGETEVLQYEPFFERHFAEFDSEERRLHAVIRSYTEKVLSSYNRRILELVQSCPGLREEIALLSNLEQHLVLWVAKFEGVFAHNPSMCLVYVGVQERVPFPKGVESQLRTFLAPV